MVEEIFFDSYNCSIPTLKNEMKRQLLSYSLCL